MAQQQWESTHAAIINNWMAGSELGASEPHLEDDSKPGLSWNKRLMMMTMIELVCVNQMVCEDVCYLCLSAHAETERVLPQWLTGIIAVSIFLFLVFVTFLVNRAWCGKSSRSVRWSDVVALWLKTKCSNKCLCVCVQRSACRQVPDRRSANVIHWAENAQVAPRLRPLPSQPCHMRKPATVKHSMSANDRNELRHVQSLLLYKGVQQLTCCFCPTGMKTKTPTKTWQSMSLRKKPLPCDILHTSHWLSELETKPYFKISQM